MTTKNAIEAAKITKELKNFTLDVENFAIPQGFATALIGENGAGKTTLLNILAGIRLDYKGEITYFGQYSDKQKENSGDIKNRIGYIPAPANTICRSGQLRISRKSAS